MKSGGARWRGRRGGAVGAVTRLAGRVAGWGRPGIAMIVHQVAVRARLARHPGRELDLARQCAGAGDPDWAQWVQEFNRGEAALMDIRVGLSVELDDGSSETLEVENHGIWIELRVQPPVLEAIVADICAKDFAVFADRIGQLGGSITVPELEDMHVAVEIEGDLLAALRPPATGSRQPTDIRAQPGTTTENS